MLLGLLLIAVILLLSIFKHYSLISSLQYILSYSSLYKAGTAYRRVALDSRFGSMSGGAMMKRGSDESYWENPTIVLLIRDPVTCSVKILRILARTLPGQLNGRGHLHKLNIRDLKHELA